MRRLEKKLMLAAIAATPLLAGWAITDRLVLQPESRLWVEGTSTVRDFKCSAATLNATIATVGGAAASALSAGEKSVTTVSFTVPAASLDCRNGQMNEHMRKAIKAESNPTIAFELGTYELVAANDKVSAKMLGTLSLGGVTKPIALDAELTQAAAGGVRVKGVYELRMTDYGLKAPSLMMGAMKVNELVKVNFDLLLKD